MKLTTQLRAFALLILAGVIGTICAGAADSALLGVVVANAVVLPFTSLCSPLLGIHLELVSFAATAPGTGAAGAALAGDSLVVKNSMKAANIIAWWADHQTAGSQQISFPSGHDTTRGLRVRVRASEVDQLLPEGVGIEVQPQETLSVTIVGSATAGDVENGALLIMYPELRGSMQRVITWEEFSKRKLKLTSVDVTITGASGYGAGEAINAESDLLLANRDYALLGATVSGESATVWVSGPDLGNVKVGIPANDLEPELGMNFFLRLSRAFNAPLIPVINSGNKASTLVGIVQDENNITPGVTLYLALLS